MATDTGFGKVKLWDDFVHPVVDESNDWATWTENSGTQAINIDDNGYIRLATGTTAGNRVGVSGEVIWEAENGGSLIFETRIKSSSAITLRSYFVGFTDIKTIENPIEQSGTSITYSASDAVGFSYDTDADNDTWYCVGVKGDTAATAVNSGVAPAAAGTDQTLRVVLNTDGDATFWIDGKEEARIDNCVTVGTKLCPVVMVENRTSTAARTVDFDYIYVEGGRS